MESGGAIVRSLPERDYRNGQGRIMGAPKESMDESELSQTMYVSNLNLYQGASLVYCLHPPGEILLRWRSREWSGSRSLVVPISENDMTPTDIWERPRDLLHPFASFSSAGRISPGGLTVDEGRALVQVEGWKHHIVATALIRHAFFGAPMIRPCRCDNLSSGQGFGQSLRHFHSVAHPDFYYFLASL